MLTINCTGKLRKEIDFEIEESLEAKRDDFYNWHAHLITIKRRKTLVLMNVQTRYAIVLYGLKKPDFKNLGQLIFDAIKDNFKAEGIKEFYLNEYLENIDQIKYTKTYSRSIISSINYLKRFIKQGIADYIPTDNHNIIELNKENNRIPILKLEFVYPIDELRNQFKKRLGQSYNKVYRFKVSLTGLKPLIWRRIEVPADYTFWDLHVAIQDAMGWSDYHLHGFRINKGNLEIGVPDEDFNSHVLASWEEKISDYFIKEESSAKYIYDFGDYWEHLIELEEINLAKKQIDYPICLAGDRACPPEDCGGIPGYQRLVGILDDPNHEEYDFILEWLGGAYKPDDFDSSKVKFDDPQKRFNNLD
ncbi:Plasmid pRiA4b ORF-3-like protein [Halobacteroides halobius DSM 5150]|uniref:Plasmid pRiA4b ORF-3-like protein n=1 Tax=Halobacteroides halobius (strain ATCC 35273 / DSM 5150 / MD-1) TaxID=748449 RepID=L0K7R3_HALHC|nr:plasmid pRiA4b ORF-3 family protein [Halobacteroides halobius]AGB41066.1 Plasmid pRiA4b ORF-3-like protein [Halobacteroides halobius DSM 5150]